MWCGSSAAFSRVFFSFFQYLRRVAAQRIAPNCAELRGVLDVPVAVALDVAVALQVLLHLLLLRLERPRELVLVHHLPLRRDPDAAPRRRRHLHHRLADVRHHAGVGAAGDHPRLAVLLPAVRAGLQALRRLREAGGERVLEHLRDLELLRRAGHREHDRRRVELPAVDQKIDDFF